MKKDIKNANGKIIGYIEEDSGGMSIHNGSKPILNIKNEEHIRRIQQKDLSFVVELYDDYTMTIAEIAALYREPYFRMSSIIKTLPVKTEQKSGRRNSSYGLAFSEERLKHMSDAQIGHASTSTYIRTPEIREKISKKLKEGYRSGRIAQDPAMKSKAWAEGKYAHAKMGRGIQGFFHSIKMNKDMYFRSLMELNFLIIIENPDDVVAYQTEPFQIKLPHGAHYTPDVLINGKIIVELKPKGFYKYTDMSRFCLEMAGLNNYCNKNNMGYVVVYDADIGFKSREYRKYIRNHPEIIEQYDIRFKKEL